MKCLHVSRTNFMCAYKNAADASRIKKQQQQQRREKNA